MPNERITMCPEQRNVQDRREQERATRFQNADSSKLQIDIQLLARKRFDRREGNCRGWSSFCNATITFICRRQSGTPRAMKATGDLSAFPAHWRMPAKPCQRPRSDIANAPFEDG